MGRSSLSDTSSNKAAPATPRVARLSRGSTKDADSPSPLRNPRISIDRSPKTVTSKPTIERRSPRPSTPDKPQSRIFKPSELQAQLATAQEDLKKASEKVASVEKEKSQAIDDLKEAKKLADEAIQKLQEAMVAQKRAEESSEIEKFRAVEMEQAGIEASQKKEEEWKKELDTVREQHAIDVAALLSTTEELQTIKQELAMVTDTKNQALSHAEDATKIAEIHAEKVEILSAELVRLKGLLGSSTEPDGTNDLIVRELKSELDSVKQELEKSQRFEKELAEKEKSHEKIVTELRSELDSVRRELEKVKGVERDLVEKDNSRERIVAGLQLELDSVRDELEKARRFERELIEKESSYQKIMVELQSELDYVKMELENAKGFENELVEKEKSHKKIVMELKHELNEARGFEKELITKVRAHEKILTDLQLELVSMKQELQKSNGAWDELAEKEKSYDEIVSGLQLELDFLQQELEKARASEKKLIEKEDFCEKLNVDLEAAKMAESYACNLLEEWKRKAEELELQVEKAQKLERSASESLESAMKQLEGNSDALHKAELEIASLKEKTSLLEISISRQKGELEESEVRLCKANRAAAEKDQVIESLKTKLEVVKEEKVQALENEKLAASSVLELLEEKNKLINEVESSKEEEEKSKKAMESLASALHEVSAEAREAKEKLVVSEAEHVKFEAQIEALKLVLKETSEKYEMMLEEAKRETDHVTNTMAESQVEFDTQMEDLKLVLKATNEKYESMLDDARCEIEKLTDIINDSKSWKADWEQKEQELVERVKRLEGEKASMEKEISRLREESSALQKSKTEWEQKDKQWANDIEEEKLSMEKEITRLVNQLRETEQRAQVAQEEGSELKSSLLEARSELGSLKDSLEDAKTESTMLKESLVDKEDALERIIQENEQLKAAKDVNVQKIEELSRLLEEATSKKQTEPNGQLSDSDKDYDLLPKVVEFSAENGHGSGRKELEDVNDKEKESESAEVAKADSKMWESCKIDREFSTEMETEQGSVEDEVESKGEFDQMNGISSESNSSSDLKQQQNKKKKPLYRKFGNLLKKGISNQK